MAEFEVKFLVRGMVSVFVHAETHGQAEVAGVENMDLWKKLDDSRRTTWQKNR